MAYTKRATVSVATDRSMAMQLGREGSESQEAVIDLLEPIAADIIADDPTVAAAAAAAVDAELAERELVEASRDLLPNGANLNDYSLTEHVGAYGLLADGGYVNAPPYRDRGNLEVMRGAKNYGATTSQRVTAANGTWWRKASNVTEGVWGPWEQIANAADVQIPAASQAILELARMDGWRSVYDPTNPRTRVMRDGKVMAIADGRGASPEMVSGAVSSDPGLTRGRFGQLDGLEFGIGGVAQALRTGSFTTPRPQPNFILAMARSRTGAQSTGRFLIDGEIGNQRNAILVASTGAGSWTMFGNGERRALNAPQDTGTHIIGAQFAGANYRLFVDGVPQYIESNGGAFDYPMGALTLGNRFASSPNSFWDGWAGPVLVYDGIPSDEVRDRMTRLLQSLSTLVPVTQDTLNSRAAIYRTGSNSVLFQKNAQEPLVPASLTKMLTAWVARQTITNERLDETVTVTSADDPDGVGSTPRLAVGDVISYRDLFYLMMLPSNNAATRVMGRVVGAQLTGTGSFIGRFIAAMNAQIAEWGWEGAVFHDTSGLSAQNRMNATQVAELMFRIVNNQQTLVTIMGTLTREITITGPNARTMTATHTIDPDGATKFPEFVAGKTGTYGTRGSVAMLLRQPDDSYRCVVTMQAVPAILRYQDARAVLDGNTSVTTSAGMTISDIDTSRNIGLLGSATRQALDALYAADPVYGPVSIITRLPGAASSTAGGIELTRVGSMVELTFADVTLPAGFAADAVIPKGFLPAASFVYRELNPDRSNGRIIPVQIGSTGRLAVFGNTATERLRGSLTWLTTDTFPAG